MPNFTEDLTPDELQNYRRLYGGGGQRGASQQYFPSMTEEDYKRKYPKYGDYGLFDPAATEQGWLAYQRGGLEAEHLTEAKKANELRQQEVRQYTPDQRFALHEVAGNKADKDYTKSDLDKARQYQISAAGAKSAAESAGGLAGKEGFYGKSDLNKKVQTLYHIDAVTANDLIKKEMPKFIDDQGQITASLATLGVVENLMDSFGMTGRDTAHSYYRQLAPTKLLSPQEQQLSNALSQLEAVTAPAYLKRTRLGQQALVWFRSHIPHVDDTHEAQRIKIPELRGFLGILKSSRDPFPSEETLGKLESYMNAHPVVSPPTAPTAVPNATPTPRVSDADLDALLRKR